MENRVTSTKYTEQVTALVEGFVQMWIKFESRLHHDLLKTDNQLDDDGLMKDNQAVTSLGLFYRVSNIIYPREKITMSELSTLLSVPFSKATRIVNWLVNKGYVNRLSDPEDRRVVLVALNDKGIKLHKRIETYTAERVQELLSKLTNEEKTILFALIAKVVSVLKEMSS